MELYTFHGHTTETSNLLLRKIVQTAHVEDTAGLYGQSGQRPFDYLLNFLRKELLGVAGLE